MASKENNLKWFSSYLTNKSKTKEKKRKQFIMFNKTGLVPIVLIEHDCERACF